MMMIYVMEWDILLFFTEFNHMTFSLLFPPHSLLTLSIPIKGLLMSNQFPRNSFSQSLFFWDTKKEIGVNSNTTPSIYPKEKKNI